jgi:aspartate/methionine/tyrosine aminotransferase
MLRRSEYLAWATRHYGHVRYDLGSSGVPSLLRSEPATVPVHDNSDSWERLRAVIARHNGLSSKEVVGTLGASHGLWLGYTAILSKGDEVLVEHPTYEPLVIAAQAAGAVVRHFDRGPSCGFALDPDRVFSALTAKTRVVAITNLHNPSGVRASDDAMQAVAQRMDARGGFLFVDEVYAPFDHLAGPNGVFFVTARRLGPNVVTTASLTKAYGLGPERVGWLLGPQEVIERAIDALVASVGQLPRPWMHHCALAFEHIDALAERTRTLLGTKRTRVCEWIAAHPALGWSNPQEGLFGLAIVSSAGNDDIRPAIEMGIERHDVVVAPGVFFGIPSAFRIGWSLPENMLSEALDRLDRLLREARLI